MHLFFLQFVSLTLLFIPFKITVFEYSWMSSLSLLLISLALLIWTSMHNHFGNFNIVPEIKERGMLIKTGPYFFIRHPMYSSVTLIAVAVFIYLFALWKILVLALLILVLYLKAKREEKLWCDKTSEYRKYKKKTKMFIPFVV